MKNTYNLHRDTFTSVEQTQTAGTRCLRILWRTRSLTTSTIEHNVHKKEKKRARKGRRRLPTSSIHTHGLMQSSSSGRVLVRLKMHPMSPGLVRRTRPMRPDRVEDSHHAPRPPKVFPQSCNGKTGTPPIHSFTTTTSSAATAVASVPWLLVADVGAADVADNCSKARLVSAYVDPNPTPAPKPIVVALDAPPPVNPRTDIVKTKQYTKKKTHGTSQVRSARAHTSWGKEPTKKKQ